MSTHEDVADENDGPNKEIDEDNDDRQRRGRVTTTSTTRHRWRWRRRQAFSAEVWGEVHDRPPLRASRRQCWPTACRTKHRGYPYLVNNHRTTTPSAKEGLLNKTPETNCQSKSVEPLRTCGKSKRPKVPRSARRGNVRTGALAPTAVCPASCLASAGARASESRHRAWQTTTVAEPDL